MREVLHLPGTIFSFGDNGEVTQLFIPLPLFLPAESSRHAFLWRFPTLRRVPSSISLSPTLSILISI
jgi:hypothetical protein